jgi:hypothetical protein
LQRKTEEELIKRHEEENAQLVLEMKIIPVEVDQRKK